MTDTGVPNIFDSNRLALRRARAARGEDRFLDRVICDSVIDRLNDIARNYDRALVIDRTPGEAAALARRVAIALDTIAGDALVAGEVPGGAPYDCILWPGGLERIADVPGALVRCRQLLRPDGVLVGALWGEGSLPGLRKAMMVADGDSPRPRMHPQIDVRAMGDLMQRAGFALPVGDREPVTLRYPTLERLIADLREAALTNILAGPVHRLGKVGRSRARGAFDAMREADGKVVETLAMVHFTGWRPDPSQPKPAARGSAGASLAEALRRKD